MAGRGKKLSCGHSYTHHSIFLQAVSMAHGGASVEARQDAVADFVTNVLKQPGLTGNRKVFCLKRETFLEQYSKLLPTTKAGAKVSFADK